MNRPVAHSVKEFYLRLFRDRSIVVHVASPYSPSDVEDVVDTLVANRTMVAVIATGSAAHRAKAISARSGQAAREQVLLEATEELLERGVARIALPRRLTGSRALGFSAAIATGLCAHKLVVVDRRGGMHTAKGPRSFVNRAAAQRLLAGGGLQKWRGCDLRPLIAALGGGVESINLTTAESLEAELFSYEGAGTLLTQGDYCRVSRLRIDDFSQALGLLDRGEREGFLLPRSQRQRARLLLSGFGAWFEGRLAGIASLDTDSYARESTAEVVGLYTITRFKGGGVGVSILEELTAVARSRGCRRIFACTSNARAADFFERNGFVGVAPTAVPAAKWSSRRRGVLPAVLAKDL